MEIAGTEVARIGLGTNRLTSTPENQAFLREAIDAGLFGRGDPEVVRRRVGEVCGMLTDDRAASIVRVEGQTFRHRGSHGGMTPAEMNIPVLAWRT